MLVIVCLLGGSLNVHVNPEKSWLSRNKIGIGICLLKVKYLYIMVKTLMLDGRALYNLVPAQNTTFLYLVRLAFGIW